MVVVAGLAIGPLLYAQKAPDTALPPGDAVRGKAIFEGSKGNCSSCHRAGGIGSLYGPDLSAIGSPRVGGAGGAVGNARVGGAAPGAGSPTGGGAVGAPPLGPSEQLLQSILDPNAVVSVQNRYVRLTMKDGKTVWGKLLNLDTFDVQIFDSTEKLANISRKDVREMTMTSPMPSYRDKLTTQELADVIGYLLSLKGQ
jgi:putative heme-binding domain-containing protein